MLRGAEFIVDLLPIAESLGQGSCSCIKYQEYQALCSHAIACIQSCGLHPYSYFHLYYKWVTIQETYEFPIRPVTIQGLEVLQVGNIQPLSAPIRKPKRGRPKVAQIRATYRTETRVYNCSVCLQPGHNRRICPNQPVGHGRAQRARHQLVEGKY